MDDLEKLLQQIPAEEAKLIGTNEPYDDPFFTEKDLDVDDHITRLTRFLFIMNKIGLRKYNDLYNKFVKKYNIDPETANRNRGNHRKTIRSSGITYKFLANVIMPLLDYSIIDITLTVRDADGKTSKISSLKAEDLIPKHFNNMLDQADRVSMNVNTPDGPVEITMKE